MYHDTPPLTRKSLFLRIGIGCIFIAGIALLLSWAFGRIGQDLNDKGAIALRDSILQSAIQCYAVEGSYPASLEYLEQNYGLQINHERYIVTYNAFASNLVPQISVLQVK